MNFILAQASSMCAQRERVSSPREGPPSWPNLNAITSPRPHVLRLSHWGGLGIQHLGVTSIPAITELNSQNLSQHLSYLAVIKMTWEASKKKKILRPRSIKSNLLGERARIPSVACKMGTVMVPASLGLWWRANEPWYVNRLSLTGYSKWMTAFSRSYPLDSGVQSGLSTTDYSKWLAFHPEWANEY